MALAQNIKTALTRPSVLAEFASWIVQRRVLGRAPRKRFQGAVRLSGFRSFSEFYSCDKYTKPEEVRLLRDHRYDGDAVLDVGANVGIISLLIAHFAPDQTVYSFEPHPEALAALKANVALNGAGNVRVIGQAVSDRSGSVHFAETGKATATARMDPDGASRSGKGLSVPCTTLDAFCAAEGIERISLLKVDVEGFETAVFRGAHAVLSDLKPTAIYFEVCPALTSSAGFEAGEPAAILERLGYGLLRFDDAGELVPTRPEEAGDVTYDNWLAILPDAGPIR